MNRFVLVLFLFVVGFSIYYLGYNDGTANREARSPVADANAEDGGVSPTRARERDTYYPNSEDLKPDEMRVIACGTGMPQPRLSQSVYGRTVVQQIIRAIK